MPKILIVSATCAELKPLLTENKISAAEGPGQFLTSTVTPDLYFLITGAGMVNTAFELGKLIGAHFDLAINAGVAGSFTRFEIGQVVNVTRDCFCELGAEDGKNFIPMDELGLGFQHVSVAHPFENDLVRSIPQTNGITVNTVHGNEKSINRVIDRYQPHIESMEGAAFVHAANAFGWKALQLRAISNLVEKRNRSSWNLELAIRNLNDVLSGILHTFTS